jgi:DNA repair exonuclease SbcCD ATPase subunit
MELPVDQAGKLMKMYSKELVDMSKMAKPQSVSTIKEIKDRDEKIAALTAKIAELESALSEALKNDEAEKETKKEEIAKLESALKAAKEAVEKNKDKNKAAELKAKVDELEKKLKDAKVKNKEK